MSNDYTFRNLGATNHTQQEREQNDYYATEPKATQELLKVETFNKNIWECAVGEKHITNVLVENGYNVRNSDLIKRCDDVEILDFLSADNNQKWHGDIITNPPYKLAIEFVYKALELLEDGNKVAMLLRLQFLEGKKRKQLFLEHPPKYVYVFSGRVNCAKNGDFVKYGTSALSYAWYVWEKGYKGETIIKWIN